MTIDNAKNTLASYSNEDNGKNGKIFEAVAKIALGGKISSKTVVSAKGKTDTTKNGIKYECKTNCGELGENLTDILKNDFVIYSPVAHINYAFVLTSADFLAVLGECGLIRYKKKTSGDRVYSIQSYKNSNKKLVAFFSALEAKGEPFSEYLAKIDGKEKAEKNIKKALAFMEQINA